MNKETFLKDYIEIETKAFIKADKNKKFDNLFENLKSTNLAFSFTDTLDIVKHLTNENITIRQPLFQHLIYPILSEEIEKDNVEAIKTLGRLGQHLTSYQGYTKDYKYSFWALLDKGLNLSPDDKELLELFENKTRNYINYTLHEIPTGVLYGANGATIEECEELIQEAERYENVCHKLQIDRAEIIEECKYYYPAYRDYLSVFKNYQNFADYLKKVSERKP